MTTPRRLLLASLTAPLALALSACSDSSEGGEIAEGEAIAPIAAPDGQEWTDIVTVSEYDGYVLGNPDAPIKVIEYGSLTCGACAVFAQNGAEPLKEDYVSTGVVSFELRNQVHNVFDMTLARLTRCSAPESFHALSDQVWANFDTIMAGAQEGGQALQAAGEPPEGQLYIAIAEAAGFFEFFAARGISRDQGAACLADTASIQAIGERSDEQSEEFGVTGTPTFFINGSKLDGISWDVLEPALQRAGARTE